MSHLTRHSLTAATRSRRERERSAPLGRSRWLALLAAVLAISVVSSLAVGAVPASAAVVNRSACNVSELAFHHPAASRPAALALGTPETSRRSLTAFKAGLGWPNS